MTRSSADNVRRARAAVLGMALALAGGALVAVPSGSAYAMISGCTISSELQASADREGISCVGDDGAGVGLLAPTSQVGYCNFAPNTDQLPVGMLGFLSDHLYSYTLADATPVPGLSDPRYRTQTTYVNDKGRITGRVTYQINSYGTFALQIDSFINAGAKQTAFFNCSTSKSGFTMSYADTNPFYIPTSTATPTPVAGGTSPTAPPGAIQVTGSVTALPGHPAEYIGRINLTNTSSSSASDADVNFNESVYSVDEFFALPGDANCGIVGYNSAYRCEFDSIAPGATRTFVVHLVARTGVDVTQPLAVSVTNPGDAPYAIYYGGPVVYHAAVVQNDYLMEMPH